MDPPFFSNAPTFVSFSSPGFDDDPLSPLPSPSQPPPGPTITSHSQPCTCLRHRGGSEARRGTALRSDPIRHNKTQQDETRQDATRYKHDYISQGTDIDYFTNGTTEQEQ